MFSERSQPRSSSTESSQIAINPSAKMPRFGVAVFDDPKIATGGWACLPGDEPTRFSSMSELANSTMWITSLDYGEYMLRAKSQHHLRRIDYLRSSLLVIAQDLGFRAVGTDARECSQMLALIYNRAMMIAISAYGWTDPLSVLRDDVLADDIRKVIAQPPKVLEVMRSPLISAYQSYSSPDFARGFEADSLFVSLRKNRMHHSSLIMSTPVPDEGWMYHPTGQALSVYLNPEKPCLVEATVELSGADPELAALIAFGSSPGNKRSIMRKWISQPELVWLSKHTRVSVNSAYFATAPRMLPTEAMLPTSLVADPLFALSYGAGLIAECHWSSLAGSIYDSKSKSVYHSSWAVWLRAADRAASFSLALAAHKANFHVTGYGNGTVTVRLTRARLMELLDFAEANGVSYPNFDALLMEHGQGENNNI